MLAGESQNLKQQEPLESAGVIVESQRPELPALELALEIGRVSGTVKADRLAGASGNTGPQPHRGEM